MMQLPKDILLGLRPILANFAGARRPSFSGWERFARSLEHFTNNFNVDSGTKLLDHSPSLADLNMLVDAARKPHEKSILRE